MSILFESASPEERPSAEDWQYQFVERVSKGLNLSVKPHLIDDDELVVANNIRFDKDQALSDLGYVTFGAVIRGKPRITFQFFLSTGSSQLILITNLTFYVWNTVKSEWQYFDDGTSTDLTAISAATDTTLTVTSITGFSDGDFIGVDLDSGLQHQTTVSGAPSGTTVTMADAIPAGENAAVGNLVKKAVVLAGSDDIPVSITTWAAFDKLYFANGVDTPKQFDATSVTDISNLPGTTFSCRIVAIFNNYLLLMNSIEDGTAKPQRVRWGNPGVDDNFNALVNFIDLYESEDFIVASEPIGNTQIIYKERSIYKQEFLGLSDQTFQFTRTIDAEGALNQDAVINLGDEHLFMGNANIYKYDGGFSIEPVGDNIFSKIFAQDGELNTEFSARSFATYVEELDEAWFFYPAGSDEFPKNVAKFQVSTRAWSTRKFGINIVGFGFFQKQSDVIWSTAVGTWASNLASWNSKRTQASAPTIHFCSGDQLQVYEYDYIAADDAGTAISYELVTRDFYVPNRELRFNRYDIRLRGSNILIEASYNFGDSWETLGTVSPGVKFSRQRLFKQFIGETIRFRFTGSAQFGLESIGFTFKRESVINA